VQQKYILLRGLYAFKLKTNNNQMFWYFIKHEILINIIQL